MMIQFPNMCLCSISVKTSAPQPPSISIVKREGDRLFIKSVKGSIITYLEYLDDRETDEHPRKNLA